MVKVVNTIPGFPDRQIEELIEAQPSFIDITTGVAGDETKIEHNLGRVPNGYAIVRQTPGHIFSHGHADTNTAWDSTFMYIVFSEANLELTLAVY